MRGSITSHPHHRARGRRRRRPYPLKRFAKAYLAAIALWLVTKVLVVAVFGLDHMIVSFLVMTGVYLWCGIRLSRLIGRYSVYNPNFATIATVAKANWHTVIAWPVAVPVFLIQVFVARHL
jgi:hypothetical protein